MPDAGRRKAPITGRDWESIIVLAEGAPFMLLYYNIPTRSEHYEGYN